MKKIDFWNVLQNGVICFYKLKYVSFVLDL